MAAFLGAPRFLFAPAARVTLADLDAPFFPAFLLALLLCFWLALAAVLVFFAALLGAAGFAALEGLRAFVPAFLLGELPPNPTKFARRASTPGFSLALDFLLMPPLGVVEILRSRSELACGATPS